MTMIVIDWQQLDTGLSLRDEVRDIVAVAWMEEREKRYLYPRTTPRNPDAEMLDEDIQRMSILQLEMFLLEHGWTVADLEKKWEFYA